MDAVNRRAFLGKAKQIRLGDSYWKVLSSLGPPTVEDHRGTDWPRPPILYHEMDWYLTIWERGSVNEEHDEYVSVIFDEDKQLVREVAIFLIPRSLGDPTTRWGKWPDAGVGR